MIGQTISHYKILEKLGEGGMGVVYKAQDVKLDRVVALKFLPPQIISTEVEQERFLQEAKAAATLNHPNVCTVYGIHEHADQQFIEMEFVDGVTLRHKIASGPMQIDAAIRYAIQIADALQEAHSKGIVHRDIKAENVMVNAKDQVKVMDFGLAKFKGVARKSLTTSTVGTLAYMAPEQIQGTQVDARSDIFSSGVVLFEMLTGHLPFRGEHEAAIIYSILNEEAVPLDKYRADASSELLHVLNRALEKDPEDRYQTVHEMLIDLRRLKKETTRVVRPSTAVQPSEGLFRLPKSLREAGGDFGSLTGKPSEGLLSQRRFRAASIVAGAITVLALLYFFAWPPLANLLFPTERIPVAVITFENQTGDAAFDYLRDAIPNLLTTSLEQSQYMRVTTWERMQDLLKQMGKQDVKVIDRDLGFELCRRDSVRALVVGSYIKAGEMFAIDIKIIDVETKKLLKSASSRGEGVGSILKTQIDDLSKQISSGFGVPEISIAAEQKPVAEVTTSSMDAYNYFLRGVQEGQKLYYQDARRFFEKAVQLDTTFATAYLNLGGIYSSLGESRLSREAYQKAFAHADKTSGRERLRIDAAYASVVERNPAKRIHILQQIVNEYPKEKSVHQSLGVYYRGQNEYEKALREFQAVLSLDPQYGIALSELGYTYLGLCEYDKAMETFKRYASVSPGDANPLDDMGDAYFHMGRLDEAIEKYKEAYTIEPKWGSRWSVAHMHALKEEYTTALHYLDEHISRVEEKGRKAEAILFKGFYLNWLGNLRNCLNSLNHATELFKSVGNEDMVLGGEWLKAWICYDRGMSELSRKHNNAGWREFWSKRYPTYSGMYSVWHNSLEGLIDLAEGRQDLSRAKLHEVRAIVQKAPRSYQPDARFLHDILYSELLLAQDSCDAVIALWKTAEPVPFPPTPRAADMLGYNLPLLRDVLARAYVKKGEIDKAIAEYERLIVIDPNRGDRRFINPRYHYRLAKLYEQNGMNEKAIKECTKFLELWKNADKELPEPKDARRRLAALKQK